ncbi:Oligopeptide ABC transporter, ATP-binding protein [Sulfitobacter noctilucicola]|uniref:Peptide/nickel transport system ATP-binding protein n=1 Tax=Sulfitobacter noctilucicola TaxID=1342301 RepID=A0A7W6Q4A9_9RHOB|nr:ABC transporter ATP-binding protein [Sulfitobacter noctilucicola]KIN62735.1 Oligopeptide ABC transporter, ATP-binding protein [Sulfitobacter noctilucicola]MBB4172732.1 peptide/nickel transport system ATP-binding protein [Sulfitobacter noctilucicola]
MANVLDVKGLTVRLPGSSDRMNAVEDISFSVGAGELVCVVGESGSGKSVTAQAVMGLLPKELKPSAGETQLQGEDTLAASPNRLRDLRGTKMAMIFQEPMTALNPVTRVGEQIGEVLEIHTDLSKSDRRNRAIEIMEAVHLPDPERMVDSFPHQLSGGQRQRIMIAMALVLDPVLLIADEPTTALDVTTQAQILKLVKEMQERRGTGVLFITHDFGVVAEIADRIVVMQNGRIIEQGPREQILQYPSEPYTQMLMSSVPSMTPPSRTPVVGDPAITVRGLNKIYGRTGILSRDRIVHAAKDIDLDVVRGETLGIVGESGSGKSTVARCIARLISPTSGTINLQGTEIATLKESRLRPIRSRIQIVFQDPYRSLNPRRTIGMSLIEAPMNFGVTKEQAITEARGLMELVGLSADALERYPHQFSGGQRQRICIARALAVKPEILIADEAVSALDVSVQAQVLELLDDIRDKYALAMLFITHDLRVAAQICDRLMVMQNGVVVEQGPTEALFANPTQEYTRLLLEAAPGTNVEFGSGIAV